MGERWLNREAVEWVIWESDVPADQFAVMLVVASFTDVQGRGAYPARSLVARLTRRDKSTVIRSLAALVKHGHLLEGDWRRVLHIRSDRRPKVYDLPDKYRLWITRERGSTTPPRGAPRGGKRDSHGVANQHQRGGTTPPEEFLKNSGKGAAGAQPPAAPPSPAENHAACRLCGNRLDSPYHRNVCKGEPP